jgi:hypothetical protein
MQATTSSYMLLRMVTFFVLVTVSVCRLAAGRCRRRRNGTHLPGGRRPVGRKAPGPHVTLHGCYGGCYPQRQRNCYCFASACIALLLLLTALLVLVGAAVMNCKAKTPTGKMKGTSPRSCMSSSIWRLPRCTSTCMRKPYSCSFCVGRVVTLRVIMHRQTLELFILYTSECHTARNNACANPAVVHSLCVIMPTDDSPVMGVSCNRLSKKSLSEEGPSKESLSKECLSKENLFVVTWPQPAIGAPCKLLRHGCPVIEISCTSA